MIIFHVFLKNNLLVTNPKAKPRRECDWDHESMDEAGDSGERCRGARDREEGRSLGGAVCLGFLASHVRQHCKNRKESGWKE